ncbi:hypothetical protein [Pseudomonas sp. MWU12-2323]|uniref:hypothetical protein n=1 Tax=Pseudomonas sp. MWU12-2323 TaxID=2651296 RepID=UPI00128BD98E|nr:hypothetical protein [Pseudomonas sp. MWU12-2323]MPQ71460.1 hypothetical protein [Pseudomonas sp. MWU12-2323]
MIRSALLLAASTAFAVALAGCTDHTATQPQPITAVAAVQTEQTVPVFIILNCQASAGEQYCEWLEPRDYRQPNEPVQANVRVTGIAL